MKGSKQKDISPEDNEMSQAPFLEDVQRNLRFVIRQLLELPENSVRPAGQSILPPFDDGAIVTLELLDIKDQGLDESTYLSSESLGDDLQEVVQGQRLLRTRIKFFHKHAFEKGAKLQQLLQSQEGEALLREKDLGYIGFSDLVTSAVDVQQEGAFEDQAQFDFDFYAIFISVRTQPSFNIFPYGLSYNAIYQKGELRGS